MDRASETGRSRLSTHLHSVQAARPMRRVRGCGDSLAYTAKAGEDFGHPSGFPPEIYTKAKRVLIFRGMIAARGEIAWKEIESWEQPSESDIVAMCHEIDARSEQQREYSRRSAHHKARRQENEHGCEEDGGDGD